MTQNDWNLILLALVAIGMLVLLVTRWKVNAFIALFAAALLVGAGAVAMGLPSWEMAEKYAAGQDPWESKGSLNMLRIIDFFTLGMGKALASTAAIIALGIMLGKFLAESGGAEVLAKRFAAFFGAERVLLCIMALALVIGLVTWFAVGLVLLLPILFTLVRETKKPFLLLAIPLLSVLSVMHGLMPPHPGPVAAIGFFKADTGQVLGWGFLIGIPIAVLAGPMFARRAVRYVAANPPEYPEKSGVLPPGMRLPSAGLTLFTILLPVLLMLVATAAELIWNSPQDKASTVRIVCSFFGNPVVALTVAAVFASWSLGVNCGYTKDQILKFTEASVATVGMTLLVVGAGGGFAKVLDLSGVSRAMGKMAELAHLPPLLYGWLIAAFIRVATGSATVSITVAAGLMVPVLAQHHGYVNPELLIIAIGCGSLFLSHFNDGGFWIVKDCLGLTVGQTLRTWTVTETIIGIAGLLLTLAVHAIWSMFFMHPPV